MIICALGEDDLMQWFRDCLKANFTFLVNLEHDSMIDRSSVMQK